MAKSTSPTPIRTVEEQLRSLYHRRSVVDRLIQMLERYRRVNPESPHKKKRAA